MLLNKRWTYSYYTKYNDYCKKSTIDSIKKITDNCSLEREFGTFKFINPFDNDANDDNDNNNSQLVVYKIVVIILSITYISSYFYKK